MIYATSHHTMSSKLNMDAFMKRRREQTEKWLEAQKQRGYKYFKEWLQELHPEYFLDAFQMSALEDYLGIGKISIVNPMLLTPMPRAKMTEWILRNRSELLLSKNVNYALEQVQSEICLSLSCPTDLSKMICDYLRIIHDCEFCQSQVWRDEIKVISHHCKQGRDICKDCGVSIVHHFANVQGCFSSGIQYVNAPRPKDVLLVNVICPFGNCSRCQRSLPAHLWIGEYTPKGHSNPLKQSTLSGFKSGMKCVPEKHCPDCKDKDPTYPSFLLNY